MDYKNFSSHLFWDIDVEKIKLEDHMPFLVNRVMQYGTINVLDALVKYVGIDQIVKVAINLKDLDSKSISFLSHIGHIKKEKF